MVDLKKKKERVLVEYKSESKDKFINIEDMNEVHLINAIRKIVTCEKGAEFRVTDGNIMDHVYVSNTTTVKEVVEDTTTQQLADTQRLRAQSADYVSPRSG